MEIDFESLRRLIINDRTVRRFRENEAVSYETLEHLVELTRYCHSGRNAQPLRYIAVCDADMRKKVFPTLKWAGYFKDWDGPEEGERPTAYLIQCLDTHYGKECLCDDGLQLEAICLGMRTLGLGGCIIKAFNAPMLSELLKLDARYQPRYVLAIGYPAEEVRIEDMSGEEDADFKYYRTADGVHHVPKRPLAELFIHGRKG
ncbi:MAG: nitroreductase family protein [Muribaculaceae bacterium]|nr:nitroreductase family protein [Muribaculaceae bacterium]